MTNLKAKFLIGATSYLRPVLPGHGNTVYVASKLIIGQASCITAIKCDSNTQIVMQIQNFL